MSSLVATVLSLSLTTTAGDTVDAMHWSLLCAALPFSLAFNFSFHDVLTSTTPSPLTSSLSFENHPPCCLCCLPKIPPPNSLRLLLLIILCLRCLAMPKSDEESSCFPRDSSAWHSFVSQFFVHVQCGRVVRRYFRSVVARFAEFLTFLVLIHSSRTRFATDCSYRTVGKILWDKIDKTCRLARTKKEPGAHSPHAFVSCPLDSVVMM